LSNRFDNWLYRVYSRIAYTEDVSLLFEQLHVSHHLFADDMQAYIDVSVADVDQARTVLHDCINHVSGWCMSRRLQLNAGKTELIWFGSRASLAKLSADELDLQPGVHTIHPATAVRLA